MAVQGPRGAKPQEIGAIVELSNAVFRPRGEGHMGRDYPLLFAPENAEDLRVFVDEGRPVSLVGIYQADLWLHGIRQRAGCIGSVCTHADYRGQGLATRLMKDARAKAAADGCTLLLISGGRGLYRRLDYVDPGGYVTYRVGRKRLPQPGPYVLEEWSEQHLPELVRLHSTEPVRFGRPPEDFRGFLSCGHVENAPGDVLLVREKKGRHAAAYVATWRAGAGGLDDEAVSVREMAGSRAAVAHALSALLDRYGAEEVHLDCLAADGEMRALARVHGWPTEAHGFHGTLGIIQPARFWSACGPLFAERIGEEKVSPLRVEPRGDGLSLLYEDEELTLEGMSDVTRLAFLPRGRRNELQLDLPADSELRGLLEKLLPLPLPAYGLNFI
ncbi:MAG: GNAT family N-acetyltransferase [Candidatus Brocadiia bacterium]